MKTEHTGSVYFTDLAQHYFPDSNKDNARRNLNNHIRRCTDLYDELKNTGYLPFNHRILTPKQYQLILDYLGD